MASVMVWYTRNSTRKCPPATTKESSVTRYRGRQSRLVAVTKQRRHVRAVHAAKVRPWISVTATSTRGGITHLLLLLFCKNAVCKGDLCTEMVCRKAANKKADCRQTVCREEGC